MAHIDEKVTTRATVRKVLTRTVLLAAAASALIIGGLNWHFYRLSPSAYDLRILGQSRLRPGSPASLRVAVFDHGTDEPIGHVPVRVTLHQRTSGEEIQLAAFTTDEHGGGSPQFRMPDWDDGRYELRVTAQPVGR